MIFVRWGLYLLRMGGTSGVILTSNLHGLADRTERKILIDANVRKLFNLKEIGQDLDFLPQFSKMSTFFEILDLKCSKSVGWNGRHFERRNIRDGSE